MEFHIKAAYLHKQLHGPFHPGCQLAGITRHCSYYKVKVEAGQIGNYTWLFLTLPGLNLSNGLIRSWTCWIGNQQKFMNMWLRSVKK